MPFRALSSQHISLRNPIGDAAAFPLVSDLCFFMVLTPTAALHRSTSVRAQPPCLGQLRLQQTQKLWGNENSHSFMLLVFWDDCWEVRHTRRHRPSSEPCYASYSFLFVEVLNLPRSGKKRQREDKAGTDAEGKEEGLRAAASLYNDQLLLPVATTS